MSERWASLKGAFETAVEGDAVTRESVMARFADDPATRAELRALLEAHDRCTVFEEGEGVARLGAGGRVGPFVLGERVGTGGFGEVYRAEQTSPVVRRAAVKVLYPSGLMGSGVVRSRFDLERQTLAGLEHPSIARFYEAGETELGGRVRPWLAMEYVEGERIDRWGAGRPLREVIGVFAKVVQGVQYAHRRGVIHRDIKPANILVEAGPEPMPRLIDFGVAKVLESDGGAGEGLTVGRVQVGTPAYMPPEQVAGSGVVDVRADVYSLGAVLYDLMVPVVQTADGGAERLTRTPERLLSRRWKDPGEARLARGLARILEKALRAEPAARYVSADAFGADLAALMAGEPTSVGRYTHVQRFGWAWRRSPLGWSAAAVVVIGLLGVAGGATWGYLRVRAERDVANAALELTEKMLTGIDPDIAQGRDVTLLLERVRETLAELDRGVLSGQPEAEVRLRTIAGMGLVKLGRGAEAQQATIKALELARRSLPAGHVATREASVVYLDSLMQQGFYFKAAEVAEQAEREFTQERGSDERSRLADFNLRFGWANTALLAGDLQGAVRHGEVVAALAARQPQLPPVAMVLAEDMASSLAAAIGDRKGAVVYAERAMEWVAKDGSKPPAVARAHNNLGTRLQDAGRLAEALEHKQKALALARTLYPTPDLRVAALLNNVSIALAALQRHDEAAARMDESLALYRRLFADRDHPGLAQALDHSGVRHAVTGTETRDSAEIEKGAVLAEESLAMRRRLAMGRPDGAVAHSLVTMGRIRSLQRRLDLAEPYFEESISIWRTLSNGHDHPELARVIYVRGVCRTNHTDWPGALPLLGEAFAMGQRLFPREPPAPADERLVEWGEALATTMRALGDEDGAREVESQIK